MMLVQPPQKETMPHRVLFSRFGVLLFGSVVVAVYAIYALLNLAGGAGSQMIVGIATMVLLQFLTLLRGEKPTELTETARSDIRHDVRGEIEPINLQQQAVAEDLLKREQEQVEERKRLIVKMDDIERRIDAKIDAYAKEANGVNEKLLQIGEQRLNREMEVKQVEVVNSPDHPVPVQSGETTGVEGITP